MPRVRNYNAAKAKKHEQRPGENSRHVSDNFRHNNELHQLGLALSSPLVFGRVNSFTIAPALRLPRGHMMYKQRSPKACKKTYMHLCMLLNESISTIIITIIVHWYCPAPKPDRPHSLAATPVCAPFCYGL
jgi:hypothetical protein